MDTVPLIFMITSITTITFLTIYFFVRVLKSKDLDSE